MAASVDISVVVVSYNVKPYLEQALKSIQKALDGIDSEILVVDNASGDGSAAMVRDRFPRVRLVANKENAGFARANNQALRLAKGKTVCLINPDTLVREDTFRVCLAYLEGHPEAGMVGCKVLNPDGSLQLACRRSYPTPWVAFTKVTGLSAVFPKTRLFGRYNLTFLDPDSISEVEAVSGSFMFVRRKALDDVGLLDEAFFLYGEDLDWCYRIHRKGWKIVYLPTTQIVHYKGRSACEAPFDTLRLFYGAMHLFVKKHFKKGWSFVPMWFLRAGIWIRTGFSFLLRLGGRLAVPLIDAVWMQGGLALALFVRFGALGHWASYQVVNLIYTTVWIATLYAAGSYRKGVFSSAKATGGVIFGLVLNASLTFFLPQYAFSRKVVLYAGIFNCVFLGGWRLTVRLFSRIPKFPFLGTVGRTLLRRRAIVVGTGSESRKLFERLRHRIESGYEMLGLIALRDDDLVDPENGDIPRLGVLNDLDRISRAHRIQTVIFSTESVDFQSIVGAIAGGGNSRLDFKMAPRDLDVIIGSSSIDSLADVPLVDLDYQIYRAPNLILKRLMDIAAATALLPVLIPISATLLIHPAYRFRKREIAGASSKPVTIRELWKGDKKVGGWLGLVPLFRSVLAGDLSLVGMEIQQHPDSAERAGFKPGLTGLVHIQRRNGLKPEEKERYRLYYLKNYSLLLDFEILLKAAFFRR
jgi:GT2 family glycosyltransferase